MRIPFFTVQVPETFVLQVINYIPLVQRQLITSRWRQAILKMPELMQMSSWRYGCYFTFRLGILSTTIDSSPTLQSDNKTYGMCDEWWWLFIGPRQTMPIKVKFELKLCVITSPLRFMARTATPVTWSFIKVRTFEINSNEDETTFSKLKRLTLESWRKLRLVCYLAVPPLLSHK